MRTPLRTAFVLVMAVLLAFGGGVFASPVAADSEGTVKIHAGPVETPTRTSNDTKVCSFHVHGIGFDRGQQVDWHIDEQDPDGAKDVVPSTHVTADADGNWTSDELTLSNEHYKLNWNLLPEGTVKHKEFEVSCGSVQVFKYNDLDNDGEWDAPDGTAGEPGLSGWSFTVQAIVDKEPSGPVETITTGADPLGKTRALSLVDGTYRVCETAKAGWITTEPDEGLCQDVTLRRGETPTVTFGNVQIAALRLTSMCSVDPALTREWRVRNTNAFDVPFTWEVYGTDQHGRGVALANADTFFTTETVAGPNTTKIYWNGGETVKASGGATCPPVTGSLRVFKYNDLDGDGERDPANGHDEEPGLAGWSFTIQKIVDREPVGDEQTVTTGSDGYTVGTDLAPARYRVCEVDQDGWTQTEPAEEACDEVDVPAGQGVTVTFGNHETAFLRIFKYNDLDNDGAWDQPDGTAGEPGLSGWSFTVEPYAEVSELSAQLRPVPVYTTGTDPLGYVDTDLGPGVYRVCEQAPLPAYWTNTDPAGSMCKTVRFSEETTTVRFGNYYNPPATSGSLLVTKYNDTNRNGSRELGEPGLAGWTFEVRMGTALVRSITTDASGNAGTTLGDGTYTVGEVMQAGWTSTDPGGTTPTKTVSIVSGAQSSLLFGNAPVFIPATTQTQVVVVKYADTNANGKRDTGEGTLANFTFTIRSADGIEVRVTTGADGSASMLNLPLGTYAVTEDARTGWMNTDPGGPAIKTFTLSASATSVTIVFGNAEVRLPSTATDETSTGMLLVIMVIAGLALALPRRTTRMN